MFKYYVIVVCGIMAAIVVCLILGLALGTYAYNSMGATQSASAYDEGAVMGMVVYIKAIKSGVAPNRVSASKALVMCRKLRGTELDVVAKVRKEADNVGEKFQE